MREHRLFSSAKLSFSKLRVPVFFVTCLFLLSTLNICAASSTEWDILLGGSSDDLAVGIIQTDDGGFVIVGTTHSFGAGSSDFWLTKLDTMGNMEWNRTYGGPHADTATAIIQTSDTGYAIAGTTNSFGAGDTNFWLVKVDSIGNLQWNQTYGETTAEAKSLTQTSDSGYALVGLQENDTNSSVWLVKTDSMGNLQWNQTYEDNSHSKTVYSVVQLGDNGYVFGGSTNAYSEDIAGDGWLVKTDSEGVMQWNQTYDRNGGFDYVQALIQTSDGGFTFAGNTGGFLGKNVWIVKTDENGNIIWNTIWETPETAYFNGLIQTHDGGYIVTGATASLNGFFNSYMFLINVDVSGNIRWNSTYEGLGDNKALFAVQTDDGDYVLAGTTLLTEEGAHSDIWFAKVDHLGELVPEFPSWTILPLAMTATLIAVLLKSRSICRKGS